MTTGRMVIYILLGFFAAFVMSGVIFLLVYKPWLKNQETEIPMWLVEKEHPKNINIITKFGEDIKINDISKYYVNKYDIKDQFLSYEYNFKNESECIKVIFDEKEVWNYEFTGEQVGYPKLILFNMTEKNIFFQFPEHFYNYKLNEDGIWKLDFSIKRISFVELETTLQYNTDEINFTKDGGEEIFTPKLGYFITSVKHGGNKVWSTNKPKEAAKEVVIKIMNNYMKVIIIHSINGKVGIFYTAKKNNMK